MSSSWPVGVTTQEDMHRYAKTLFGDCKIENLLTGTQCDAYPGCFLIRVKGACKQGEWKDWPTLTEQAMSDRTSEVDFAKAKAELIQAAAQLRAIQKLRGKGRG